MSDVNAPKGRTPFVWVKDKAGNEFICPVEALKDPKKASEVSTAGTRLVGCSG